MTFSYLQAQNTQKHFIQIFTIMKLHHLALAAVVKADCRGNDNPLECVTECSTESGYFKLGRGTLSPLYSGRGKSVNLKAEFLFAL